MATTTVFQNGRFFTALGGPKQPEKPSFAECMITHGDKISFVGPVSSAAVQDALAAGASTRDVGGRVVVPGFVDGHMHLMLMGQALTAVALDGCKSLDDIRAAIRAWAAANPAASLIFCCGWMHSMTGAAPPTAALLDDLDPRPIFINAKDLHSSWCNSAALAAMAIDEHTPEVPGGTISRDERGKPTGLLSEAANINLVWPYVARVATVDERVERLEAAFTAYSAAGYTGLVEMAMDETAWGALQELMHRRRANGLPPPPVRVAAHWLISPKDTEAENVAQVDRAAELHAQFNLETSPSFRIAGIKVICDGVIDACTAALSEPYSNNVDCPPIWSPAQLQPVVDRAASHGLQVALHAIGDAAITLAIDALESASTSSSSSPSPSASPPPPLRRPRIEHLELASARDAARLGALGITASIQPGHADPAILRAWPRLLGPPPSPPPPPSPSHHHGGKEGEEGKDRCGRAFAYADFLRHGAALALGSDAPTAPHAVWGGWYTATTRRSARERDYGIVVNEEFKLGLATVAAAQTAGAAWSCFADGVCGRLEVGLSADFVVVDGLEGWRPEEVADARVRETWFEGGLVFDAAAVSAAGKGA
ncbi:amidohydrolase ytcj-like [Diplodia corticola]|uniref:Amidohydrolase ytcj-like n=1 Tax=Diplodia corticola TaxID=236234 RepID=A0A1J9S484_9PEZI|nr:amidohydrolase ytcj-like [Diplodia corticola]OJD34445.1 amidohydrolase ytcj-like [Diplodia corticola]